MALKIMSEQEMVAKYLEQREKARLKQKNYRERKRREKAAAFRKQFNKTYGITEKEDL